MTNNLKVLNKKVDTKEGKVVITQTTEQTLTEQQLIDTKMRLERTRQDIKQRILVFYQQVEDINVKIEDVDKMLKTYTNINDKKLEEIKNNI